MKNYKLFTNLKKNIKIGKNNYIENGVKIYENVNIGNNNKIYNGTILYPNTIIGNNNIILNNNIIVEHFVDSNEIFKVKIYIGVKIKLRVNVLCHEEHHFSLLCY